jgi:hypothetical protein
LFNDYVLILRFFNQKENVASERTRKREEEEEEEEKCFSNLDQEKIKLNE